MYRTFALFIMVTLIAAFGCKKNEDNVTPPEERTPLVFTSLTASNTIIKLGSFTTLTVVASGDELTYTWTPEFGTIFGSGAVVDWNVCHADTFTITCEVQDKYGEKLSKSIDIEVQP